jgi:hypothetical protein
MELIAGQGELHYIGGDDCFIGWARPRDPGPPCEVTILRDGQPIATAVADIYRPELMQLGIGHGHYGFRILRSVQCPAGKARFSLVERRSGAGFDGAVDIALQVARYKRDKVLTVEDLLTPRTTWTEAEVVAHLEGLEPEQTWKRMGSRRFVEAAFLFVLGRPADDGGRARYTTALETAELTPYDILKTLFGSQERATSGPPLMSPLDAKYPFRHHPSKLGK